MNILILTGDYGAGHVKATEAIDEHLKFRNLNYNIKMLNTLDYLNPSFNKLTKSLYSECSKKFPLITGMVYYYSESKRSLVNVFVLILNTLAKRLLPLIGEFDTDVIISTHPFSTEMISYLKKIGNLKNIKLINLLTDYAPHKFWIQDYVDAYITASEQMTEDMIKRGVNKNIIYPIGIPVGVDFLKSYKKTEIFSNIGFDENNFTILLMSGSFGVDCVINIFKALLSIDKPLQIIIITGSNRRLYQKFNNLISKHRSSSIKFHLLGFTRDVSKYMKVSDVIITKPGGLTTTEAIHSHLPIIFFDAIPGQEGKNADFILKNKIGMRISKSKKSINSFSKLIDHKEILDEMKKNIISIKKSNFIDDLVNVMDSLFEKEEG